MLSRLAGLELTRMTEFRVTDSVAAEFVNGVPEEIKPTEIAEVSEKMGGNILENRVNQLICPNGECAVDEIINKALKNGPAGVFYKDYDGPRIKTMYVQCDGTGVPGIRRELAGAKGKQPDGSAKTFEAKIGAVFVVEYTADGKPLLSDGGEIYRDRCRFSF
jgi:hypothetical protein